MVRKRPKTAKIFRFIFFIFGLFGAILGQIFRKTAFLGQNGPKQPKNGKKIKNLKNKFYLNKVSIIYAGTGGNGFSAIFFRLVHVIYLIFYILELKFLYLLSFSSCVVCH
jgi:hypothetical protein